MKHYDLAIIGSGSGNSVIDDAMADWDIALVEERRAGGTCLNYGCIPSKMLAYTAEVADTVSDADDFDVDAQKRGVRWNALRDRVFGRTDQQSDEGRKGREEADNVTYYQGHAEFTGPRRLVVTDEDGNRHEFTADRIVIANGGRPVIPDVVADSGLPYETSDTIMRIDTAPRRLAVLGGGYIAAELAHVFSAAGAEVTIIEKNDLLLGGPQDDDIRHTFTDLMRARWDLRLNAELQAIAGEPGHLTLTLSDGSTVTADTLLVASGRTPNADRLNAEAGGVEVDDHGRISVDAFGRTSADGVFALGDVSSPVTLKHVANREADVVKHNLLHPDRLRAASHDHVPSAVFTQPQIASVGMTEDQCRKDHPDYLVGRRDFSDVAYGWAMQDTDGYCKVLIDGNTDLVLGAHVIGPQAATLIHVFVMAIEFQLTATDLARRPYWIHPALTEVVQNALLDVAAAA
ncbi:mycothione reductase [Mycolicibacterium madagascariense]|uniref:Mycothione reductase n=1 Tax=Mycolicibacterium madagascariense TaxID=212765 RepID=A0A7I7X9B8_9MYCO|nr:mycothione reductase [Mycolicibacterium madagascariense]MCV7014707.1 mycothione reductase [Mycolicibacterium madagascariense]BBZ26399.1 mycothione reductase [Mycolicibacterium madagascariense]